ncbi:hypothetical protein QYE76_023227 [Lolium multiflorum]|uniref:RING-type E3 ubiquitin transferase n=1 Tax=Lolium multiflorum TaxID=4521 RepID=A0AAD8RBA1_LOLMU|nr:hypothetical protein QYE76_023227 [Lolium multiflorum]
MWMRGRRNRGRTSAPPGASSASLASTATTTSEGDQTLQEDLLRDVEEEIEERTGASLRAGAQESSSSGQPSRFLRGARKAAKKVLGVGKNAAPPSPRSALRRLRVQNTASGVAGTSGSVPVAAPATGINDEARSEQQPATHTRSEFAAAMRSALAKIQEAAAGDAQGEAAFAEMEQAMAGLMDLSYKKVEPPKLPSEFATKWAPGNADALHGGAMDDPVILASGYSVDQSYQQWFISQKNTCPVTGHSLPHSLTVPNHLLRDMIAAWFLDHSDLPPSTTADTLSSPLIPPSEEQMQEILDKFSGHSVLQKEALHSIHLMSKTSKGVHPCLDKWPGLVPVLVNLKKKWKSTWARDVEEDRISVFLNLSMHRPNREILAGQNKLPAVLIKVVEKAEKLGTSDSFLAMVASTVAILSEFDVFRKRLLDTGGMKMLSDLLKIEDVLVRKETATAILAVCTDEEANASAADNDVPDMLLECFMVTDEFLLLLDRLPKSPDVLDRICDHSVELVNVVIEEHASGTVTAQGIHSAISLIFIIAHRDVSKLKVKNVEDFKERLQELSSKRIPMQTMFQVEGIIKILSDMFPSCLQPHE